MAAAAAGAEAAVEAMPYFARALFALSPVAAPGLGTFAVDKHWRLYVDPTMLGTDEGWSIPLAGAVLLHEVGHVLRDHADRADTVDASSALARSIETNWPQPASLIDLLSPCGARRESINSRTSPRGTAQPGR